MKADPGIPQNHGKKVFVQNLHICLLLSNFCYFRDPKTTFWLWTECYRKGLATSPAPAAAALPCWCPTLPNFREPHLWRGHPRCPTAPALAERDISLYTQGKHLFHKDTIPELVLHLSPVSHPLNKWLLLLHLTGETEPISFQIV